MEISDIFIIGGGIHGTAIALDAAGRRLTVTLCEKDDLASSTSSASTKLIHGGLRYLEYYDFRLVKKALREQEILMKKAPHLITPLEFVLPHEKHLRPAWLIRLGLFIYDHMSFRKALPRSRSVDLKKDVRREPLLEKFSRGFSYFDCRTDDARLTVLNALAAKENGAEILTRHEVLSAERENNFWKITYKNLAANEIKIAYAKTLINASGPWLSQFNQTLSVKLVKGSHIVVRKLYEGDFAYILQNHDNRIVFAIPYQQHFTLIGTTDVLFNEDLEKIKISDEEKKYLCHVMNEYFKKSISEKDILWSYAGVRCLFDENKKLTAISREHKLIMDNERGLPLVSLIGGKLTTHRVVAEECLDKLKPYFPSMKSAWTASFPLPGGDFVDYDFEKFYLAFKKDFSWLPENIALHYAKNYGTRAYVLLKDAHKMDDLGECFGDIFYRKELDYLIQYEWAKTADDVLWRRTKFGLFLTAEEQAVIKSSLRA